jgi:hypothetical protein
MGDEERDRLAILRRRRFLIAAAVAGVASTQCEDRPRACLKVEVVRDAEPTPQVCLSPVSTPPDAGGGPNDGSANG